MEGGAVTVELLISRGSDGRCPVHGLGVCLCTLEFEVMAPFVRRVWGRVR